jgi:hypothetical protein
MALYEILYGLFSIFFAWVNAEWIRRGKKVLHGWNGLLHIAVASVGWWLYAWPVFFLILCNVRIIFDPALNLMRGKRINYVSPNPKSIVDKLEKKLFGLDFYTPRLIYILISIICNCVYFEYYH